MTMVSSCGDLRPTLLDHSRLLRTLTSTSPALKDVSAYTTKSPSSLVVTPMGVLHKSLWTNSPQPGLLKSFDEPPESSAFFGNTPASGRTSGPYGASPISDLLVSMSKWQTLYSATKTWQTKFQQLPLRLITLDVPPRHAKSLSAGLQVHAWLEANGMGNRCLPPNWEIMSRTDRRRVLAQMTDALLKQVRDDRLRRYDAWLNNQPLKDEDIHNAYPIFARVMTADFKPQNKHEREMQAAFQSLKESQIKFLLDDLSLIISEDSTRMADYFSPRSRYWTTGEGKRLLIAEMDAIHMENALIHLEKAIIAVEEDKDEWMFQLKAKVPAAIYEEWRIKRLKTFREKQKLIEKTLESRRPCTHPGLKTADHDDKGKWPILPSVLNGKSIEVCTRCGAQVNRERASEETWSRITPVQ